MKKYLPTILLLVGLAGGFAGGYLFKNYQQNKLRNNLRNGTAQGGQRFVPNGIQGGGQNRGGLGGGVEGDIISMDDKSVTVKLADGSTKIVLFSDSTTYSNLQVSKKTDLKQGIKVAVFGKTNSDGSITADRIQLNPMAVSNGPLKTFIVDGSSFKFDPSTITVNKGDNVKITFKDDDGKHNFVIDEYGVSSNVLNSGNEEVIQFVADKSGTFEYYCSVPTHKDKGMVGTLIVK